MAGNPNIAEYGKATQFKSGCRAVENGSKGGKAFGENNAIRRRLKEIANMALRDGKIDEIKTLADAKNANLSISDALLVKLVLMALNGNIKAMNKLMELLGTDSTEAQEAPQSVTSGFIDALNGTAAEVWANEAPKEE